MGAGGRAREEKREIKEIWLHMDYKGLKGLEGINQQVQGGEEARDLRHCMAKHRHLLIDLLNMMDPQQVLDILHDMQQSSSIIPSMASSISSSITSFIPSSIFAQLARMFLSIKSPFSKKARKQPLSKDLEEMRKRWTLHFYSANPEKLHEMVNRLPRVLSGERKAQGLEIQDPIALLQQMPLSTLETLFEEMFHDETGQDDALLMQVLRMAAQQQQQENPLLTSLLNEILQQSEPELLQTSLLASLLNRLLDHDKALAKCVTTRDCKEISHVFDSLPCVEYLKADDDDVLQNLRQFINLDEPFATFFDQWFLHKLLEPGKGPAFLAAQSRARRAGLQ